MKILFCGDINSGKSTAIERLIVDLNTPVFGYITVRVGDTVYLYNAADKPAALSDAAVIIKAHGDRYERFPEVLEKLGTQYLRDIPEGSTVILDEIGTLENACPEFQRAVMRILSGNYTVLAGVKAQNTAFLRQVRKHPDCELFIITPANRDAVYEQARNFLLTGACE